MLPQLFRTSISMKRFLICCVRGGRGAVLKTYGSPGSDTPSLSSHPPPSAFPPSSPTLSPPIPRIPPGENAQDRSSR